MPGAFRMGYADAKGGIIRDSHSNCWIFASLNAAPTAGLAGYEVGCLFVNTAGSPGSLLYINTGTTSSATWTNII